MEKKLPEFEERICVTLEKMIKHNEDIEKRDLVRLATKYGWIRPIGKERETV